MESFSPIHQEPVKTNLDLEFIRPSQPGFLRFWWLGQAGFAFKYRGKLLLVDPYLSDSLAEKYKNHTLKHQRMMPVPVPPENIQGCDWYFCTHSHTDHMDPTTIQAIMKQSSPNFVIPRAGLKVGVERGMPIDRVTALNAWERLAINSDIQIEAIPSAHEDLELDEQGHYKHLGYVITFPGLRIYHSGDCVPYIGLTEALSQHNIDVAFLPINGRDKYRLSQGIAGNFTLEEAIDLCKRAQIPILVAHHFEMFDFNTLDRQVARDILSAQAGSLVWLLPEIRMTYYVSFD